MDQVSKDSSLQNKTAAPCLPPGPIESFVSGGLKAMDYYFDVPLKHTDKSCSKTITVFARRVIAVEKQAGADQMPWLLFLQGGPGFQAPAYNTGWVKSAAKSFNVLLLDQRGTGLSTPLTVQTLAHCKTPQEQADHFMQFRADSIVRDCELIREALLANAPEKKWHILGQSFGGFCITTYLSFFPESITAAYYTGGIPPIVDSLEKVYRATFKQAIMHTERYYQKFPADKKRIRDIMRHLSTNTVKLPNGGILTPRKFQQMGMSFGLSGGMDRLHALCLKALVSIEGREELSSSFLTEMVANQENIPPIYAALHEAIYCDGPGQVSDWAASRLLCDEFASTFNYSVESFDANEDKMVYFTGEHMFDFMFDDYVALEPLKECAEILAKCSTWPKLYDLEQLQKNTVPVAACVYYDDMYVDRECSENTARNIKGMQLWITNEYMHSGIRDAGEAMLNKLISMVKGEVDVPIV
ncbi:hypothetical protein DFQ27_005732 [Actinomortierella ambigua]|uniref:AB hydrolase-1 domain-containing protein n=1 Tax=Actinomortierella ambigua TaxID=1343610 RepID=A0A9P6QLX7_9FUNG|nr:hypothetical protein DFQ27_005732 [Actinomortierella ambigua]